MSDQSNLDRKYFIDRSVYNCPFCNRNNVVYKIVHIFNFDWSDTKKCYVTLVKCTSCKKESMHLSYEDITEYTTTGTYIFLPELDIDSKIFHSVPTSFFIIDNRIDKKLRELITEAEGCLKMNFLTGASACTRKSIYELLVFENIEGEHYEDRIKLLKNKFPDIDPELFDVLGSIQEMTSDKIHEQSWDKWDSSNLLLIIETLKTILYEIYVLPEIRKDRMKKIKELRSELPKKKK